MSESERISNRKHKFAIEIVLYILNVNNTIVRSFKIFKVKILKRDLLRALKIDKNFAIQFVPFCSFF